MPHRIKGKRNVTFEFENLRNRLMKSVLDVSPINPKLIMTYQSREDIAARFNRNFDFIIEDLYGSAFMEFINKILKVGVITGKDVNAYEYLIENLEPQWVAAYQNFGQHIAFYIISKYENLKIDKLALISVLDYITMFKVDFLGVAEPIFRLLLSPEADAAIMEKAGNVLIEHFNIENTLIYLMTSVNLKPSQKRLLMKYLGDRQKKYRKKREGLHRLTDKELVCRSWFGVDLEETKSRLLKGRPRLFLRQVLVEMEQKLRLEDVSPHFEIAEKNPSEFEKHLLSAVLLYHNEDILMELFDKFKHDELLVDCSNLLWIFMRYLRVKSSFEKDDERAIHEMTVADARKEVKWAKPMVIYLEDHRRYQDDFIKGLENACKLAEVSLPTTIIISNISGFKESLENIIKKSNNSGVHIIIIDGVLEDGYYYDALPTVERLAEDPARFGLKDGHIFLSFILTGDVDIARRVFKEVLEGVWRCIDGVYTKPLESYSEGLFHVFNRDGVHGIGSNEQLYRRITSIIKRKELETMDGK